NPAKALEVSLRRLDMPNLPAAEYGDVIAMVSNSYWLCGDPDNSIATVEKALANLKPGQPIIHLSSAMTVAMQTAYNCGRWSLVEQLQTGLEETYEQSLHSSQDGLNSFSGFMCIFSMALSREDQPTIDRISAIMLRLVSSLPHLAPFVQEYIAMEIA